MEKVRLSWMSIVGCCGIFLSSIVLETCKKQDPHTDITASDSAKSFSELLTSTQYAGNLTRIEYRGKLVYDRYCQICHGQEGDGKGFNAFNLQNSFGVQPADFTDSTFMANHTKEMLMNVIVNGGRAVKKSQYMPPWSGTLSNEEIQNIVAYIRSMSKQKNTPESKG
jgi:cytochrome c553